ncbi:MAG: hypothetical protein RL189_1159 [Pseudomonadota bacterium]|jgi:hypothetical protein
MKLQVLNLFVLALVFSACKNREFNNSLPTAITGPDKGKRDWYAPRPEHQVLRYEDSHSFQMLNPGYSLLMQGLYEKTIDEGNNFDWKLINTRFAIYRNGGDEPIATTDFTIQNNLNSCQPPQTSNPVKQGNLSTNCRGIFVKDQLVGAIDCEFEGSPSGLCVDKDVRKQLCSKERKKYTVVGCEIPSLDKKKRPKDVIVLK